MKYFSTRDSQRQPRRFTEIVLSGLADDGGLYLPADYPQVTQEELSTWRDFSYAQLACAILEKYCDDILLEDLREITQKTYQASVFSHTRHQNLDVQEITPLHYLGNEHGAPLYLLELSNGPTLAFKDMAMQLLGNLFEYVLRKQNQQMNILGATSGDTGSAAEYAMKNKQGIRVFMLSPFQKMSAFQQAQMYSLNNPNIINIAVQGVFDQCQDIVKAVSHDADFKQRYQIGTVNSINWARIIAQVVYYFKAYFAATVHHQQRVSFSVPSGNFGNICAGHIARMMGLPIEKLVVCTNENDVLDEFFKTGNYRVRSAQDTHHTTSPSMDISKASNFERFIFDVLDRDAQQTKQLFEQVERTAQFSLQDHPAWEKMARFGFVSGKSTHEDRLQTIKNVFESYQVMIDPHTANGVFTARQYLEEEIPMIVLETAQPMKFEAVMQMALGRAPETLSGFERLIDLPQHYQLSEARVEFIKELIRGCIYRTALNGCARAKDHA